MRNPIEQNQGSGFGGESVTEQDAQESSIPNGIVEVANFQFFGFPFSSKKNKYVGINSGGLLLELCWRS